MQKLLIPKLDPNAVVEGIVENLLDSLVSIEIGMNHCFPEILPQFQILKEEMLTSLKRFENSSLLN